MDTNWTPGPWEFLELGEVDGLGYIQDERERDLARHGLTDLSRAENVANGNLMAAAPDLFEACQYIVSAGETGDEVTAIEKARAAIKKALGEL